jgi:acetate kinase
MRNGRSVDTTMGFTALDGLLMGTRPGTLDPGAVTYLMREHGMSAAEIEDLLYHRSGLVGVAGISSDMRILLGSSDPHAREERGPIRIPGRARDRRARGFPGRP